MTLTGAGGCGKTRLGIRLARQQAQAYPDGVWLIELAALRDPALLPLALAGVLGLKDKAGIPPMDAIAEFLSRRAVLLILDNAEHLVEACAELATMLFGAASGSCLGHQPRAALDHRRAGLPRPIAVRAGTRPRRDAGGAGAFEASRLFVERAKLQRPQFEVTTQNAPAIASICRRLDGIALALELAAPVVRTLSVEELDRRAGEPLEVLTRARERRCPATGRCARSSTGAISCSTRPNRRCCDGCRSFPADGRWTQRRMCAPAAPSTQ